MTGLSALDKLSLGCSKMFTVALFEITKIWLGMVVHACNPSPC
jgi:hypothetical protein